MSVLADRKASTTTPKANWFLSATTVPPVATGIQQRLKLLIIKSDICLNAAKELILPNELNVKYQQSYCRANTEP